MTDGRSRPSGFVPWGTQKNTPGWYEDGNGCHIWTGCRSDRGYGRARADGRMQSVHRLRYEREIGPIPDGLVLDHICDNGAGGCCNPHHCRPATYRENTLRGDTITARALARTHCAKGHPLTPDNLVRRYLSRGIRACASCMKARNRAATRRYRQRLSARRAA